MRRIVRLTGIAAIACGLVFGASAQALDPYDTSPEGRAYLSLDFGGGQTGTLHFGAQLDQNLVRGEGEPLAPMLQVDFTRRGLNAARVNGLNVLRHRTRLNQDEDDGEEQVDEEEGFFEGIGNWFGSLFGGGDDEEEQQSSAPAEGDTETAADEPAGDGGYTAVDWGLLAVGAVGLGFVVMELVDSEEDPDPNPASAGGAGTPECPIPVEPLCGILLGVAGTSAGSAGAAGAADPAWLDHGTGQMGDLLATE